jgi:hypothetical protein
MLYMFHIYVTSVLSECYIFCSGFKYFSCVCKCFICIFEVFHLSSDVCYKCWIGCFKTRSGVARVAMCVRSGRDASGPCAWFGSARPSGAGPAWARETQARKRGRAGASTENRM